jgi:hypothetical protein
MKKHLALPLAILLLALSSLSCKTVTRLLEEETPAPPTPAPAVQAPPPTRIPPTVTPASACPNGDCIAACVQSLDSLTLAEKPGSPSMRAGLSHSQSAAGEYILAAYPVRGDSLQTPDLPPDLPGKLLRYQTDMQSHQRIWGYFAGIIPAQERQFIGEYVIFTDGKDEILAYVSQTETSASQWALTVDIQDAQDPTELTYTLVHEFAHLLTLSPAQVTPSQALFQDPENYDLYEDEVNACPHYFPGEGCSQENSYINLFVNRYWGDIFDEWNDINLLEDEDEYYAALDDFYLAHEDEFVTDYAPTSPEEDIAESFTYFILQPKPAGDTLAEEKVLFFYEFPELVQLREAMGAGLCAQLEEQTP